MGGIEQFILVEQLWDLRSQERRLNPERKITRLPRRVLAIMVEIYIRHN